MLGKTCACGAVRARAPRAPSNELRDSSNLKSTYNPEKCSTNLNLSDKIPSVRALRDIHIGPAGWSYADWRGRVYPEGAAANGNIAELKSADTDLLVILGGPIGAYENGAHPFLLRIESPNALS